MRPTSLATAATCLALVLLGCGSAESQNLVPQGDPDRGRQLTIQYGCASCHAIPDVSSVREGIGPDLHSFRDQALIAGQFPNRPEELIPWLQNPQERIPGTVMPNLGLTEQDARDIAAFLYGDR